MNKIFFWNAIAYAVAFFATALFDIFLELGQFQGLVFVLYLFYFGIIAAIINSILAIVAFTQQGPWKQFLIAAGSMFLLSALPAILGAQIG